MTPTAPEVLAERVDLLRALAENCACVIGECGLTQVVCNVHVALRDPMFVRHMSFARSLAVRLFGRGVGNVNSVAETLRAAKAKIADPEHWTQGALARPSRRSPLELDADAVGAGAWCAVGAIRAVDGIYELDAIDTLCVAIIGWHVTPIGRMYEGDIIDFNDRRTTRHADVLRKFDEAIALAESREAGQ